MHKARWFTLVLVMVLFWGGLGTLAVNRPPAQAASDFASSYTLSGRVFDGNMSDESKPIPGVTVRLYASNNAGQQGTLIASDTTDGNGWYALETSGSYEYYNIVETDPAGYTSVDASSVSGTVKDANWIQYVIPLAGKTLTGNKFWDRGPATATFTPTHTRTTAPPTPTSTSTTMPPTPTMTATRTPTTPGVPPPDTPTPTRTHTSLPPTPTATPTTPGVPPPDTPTPTRTLTGLAATATRTPTATATTPSGCPDLLVNGDFESGILVPWVGSGAMGLGPGRDSPHGAWLGGANDAQGEISQLSIVIPAGASPVTLEFWWLAMSGLEQPLDRLEVIIHRLGGSDTLRIFGAVGPLGQWRQEMVDLTAYAGQMIAVMFRASTDQEAPTLFRLDDIHLRACQAAAPTPTATATRPATATATATLLGRDTPTATATLPEPTPELFPRVFTGYVRRGTDCDEPVVGVLVEMFRSPNSEEIGTPAARARTGPDGMFYLIQWDTAETRNTYHNLVLTHRGVEVRSVTPAEGGQVRSPTWISFPPTSPPSLPSVSSDDEDDDNNWCIVDKPLFNETPVAWEPIPEWTSFGPPKTPTLGPAQIDLVMDGIELTQAVQCFDTSEGDANCADNSLDLVQGKLTAVRVYVHYTGVASKTVAAVVRLSITNVAQGSSLGSSSTALASQFFTVPAEWDRRYASTTANFLISSPTAGTLYAYAEVQLFNRKASEAKLWNNSAEASVKVVTTRAVYFGWTRVNYKPTPASTKYPKWPYTGSALANYATVVNDAVTHPTWWYPTAALNYSKFGTGIMDYCLNITKNGVATKVCYDIRDYYYGTPMWSWFLSNLYTIASSSPAGKSLDTLMAWFPKGFSYPEIWHALAPGVPPVTNGKGLVALAEEDPDWYLTHESAHNFGLGHYPCGSAPCGQTVYIHNWPAPYNDCMIAPVEMAFNPVKMDTDRTEPCMCCRGTTISVPEWKFLLNKLKKTSSSSAASAETPPETPYLLVSGWLDAQGQGDLGPIYFLPGFPEPLKTTEGAPGEIRLLDGAGQTLLSHRFAMPSIVDYIGDPLNGMPFSFQFPPHPDLARVQLLYDGQVVAERQPSAHPPEVAFTSPPPGGTLEGSVPVSWQASDSDGDQLSYLLLYSHDGGRWLPLAVNVSDAVYDLDTGQVPGGDSCFLKVLVSDGWHTREAVRGPYTVARKPPEAAISAPQDGATAPQGRALVLTGVGFDAEDDSLPGDALTWESNRDGLLGQGATLVLPGLTLSPSWHTITLRARDSDGQTGSASIRLFIGHRVELPMILKNR